MMSTTSKRKSGGGAPKGVAAAQIKNGSTGAARTEVRLSEDERRRMVAEAAYYRAERRGFVAGGEVEDWLTAEREINQRLAVSTAAQRPRDAVAAKAQNGALRSRPTH